MLHELDQTLASLLKRDLPVRNEVSISFAAPDDKFSASLPAVDLFLYDVRENLELRGNDDEVFLQDDRKILRRRPPVRVDVSYLITAWPGVGSGSGDSSEDEHKLLSAVMMTLLRYPRLPRELLKGGLAEQDLPPPVSTLQSGRLQSLGEFWQALGGRPKAALNYTVTLALDTSEPEVAPLVVDKEVRVAVGMDGLP